MYCMMSLLKGHSLMIYIVFLCKATSLFLCGISGNQVSLFSCVGIYLVFQGHSGNSFLVHLPKLLLEK